METIRTHSDSSLETVINLLALEHASIVSSGLLPREAEEDLALFMRIEAIVYPLPCNMIIPKHGMYLQSQMLGLAPR